MTIVTLATLLSDERKPPSEFRLFPFGEFETKKGTFVLDEDGAEEILAAYEKHGADLCIDYCHAMLDPKPADPAEAGKAAGWFRPEIRKDGLYAVDVKWTDAAAELIAAGEYRYHSPAFTCVGDTNRIGRLVNVALTNLPASQDLEPLVPLHALDRRTVKLSDSLSFNAIQEALNSVVQSKYAEKNDDGSFKSWVWVCDVYDDRAVFSKDGKLFEVTYRMEGASAVLTGDPAEVRRTYSYVKEGTDNMDKKELAKLLGLAEDATEDEIKEKLKALTGEKKEDSEVVPSSDDAKDEDEEKKLSAPTREIIALTGAPTLSQAKGKILGWKQNAEKLEATVRELSALKANQRKTEVAGLVDAAEKEGKVTPGQKEKLVALGEKDPEMLKGLLETMPKLSGIVNPAQPLDKHPVTLSEDERKLMRQMNLSEEQYRAAFPAGV